MIRSYGVLVVQSIRPKAFEEMGFLGFGKMAGGPILDQYLSDYEILFFRTRGPIKSSDYL